MTERLTLPLFSCIYLCSFFKRSFSRIVYYKIFNIVLCALQWILVFYLLFLPSGSSRTRKTGDISLECPSQRPVHTAVALAMPVVCIPQDSEFFFDQKATCPLDSSADAEATSSRSPWGAFTTFVLSVLPPAPTAPGTTGLEESLAPSLPHRHPTPHPCSLCG